MSASQKAAVLLTGLICIGVIGYFFQQTQSAQPATPLTIAPQASEDSQSATQADAAASADAAGASRSAVPESRIGLADLVAQFADVYESQKADEQTVATTAVGSGSASPTGQTDGPGVLPEPAIRESSVASATPTPGESSPSPSQHSATVLPPGTPIDVDTFNFDAAPAPVETASAGPRPSADVASTPTPRTLTIGGPAPVASVSNQQGNPQPPSSLTVGQSRETTGDGLQARVAEMPVVMRVDVRPNAVSTPAPSYQPPRTPDVLRTREAPTTPAQPLFESEPEPTPVAAVQRTYTVQPGDTFSSIAVTLFGSEKRYLDIAKANPDIDPRRMRAGQVIRLPDDVSRPTSHRSQSGGRSVASRTTSKVQYHIVGAGDNLSGIASDYYSDASKWRSIYQANRDAIGANPNRLKAGMKLTIPALD